MIELTNEEKERNIPSPKKRMMRKESDNTEPKSLKQLQDVEDAEQQARRIRNKKQRKKPEEESARNLGSKYEINLENYEKSQDVIIDKVDPKGIPAGNLLASFAGYIQTAEMLSDTDLQANYQLHWGQQWRDEYMNPSSHKGVSQFCETKDSKITFNLPFQCTLSSASMGEWPQLVIIFKGFDFFGRKITKGYAQMHFPVVSGTHTYTANIYVPEPTFYQSMLSWFSGASIEYKRDFQKIILKGEGRSIGKIRTVGKITVLFNVTLRNFERLGYR